MAPPCMRIAAANRKAPEREDDDAESNDCGICFLPLSSKAPPTFQCGAGHVICSFCRDMLELPAGRCHLCCGKVACRGSRRDYGRDLWPDYYGPHLRSRVRRGRCRCPHDECGLVGSTAELLCHFVSAHDWPVTNGVMSGDTITVHLQDGANIVAVDCIGDSDDNSRQDIAGRYLIVLVVDRETIDVSEEEPETMDVLEVEPEMMGVLDEEREMIVRTVSAFCIRPRGPTFDGPSFWVARDARCQLSLSYTRSVATSADDGTLVQHLYMKTDATVACSDLARGLPDRRRWFKAHVLPSLDREDNEETVEVNLRTVIH